MLHMGDTKATALAVMPRGAYEELGRQEKKLFTDIPEYGCSAVAVSHYGLFSHSRDNHNVLCTPGTFIPDINWM